MIFIKNISINIINLKMSLFIVNLVISNPGLAFNIISQYLKNLLSNMVEYLTYFFTYIIAKMMYSLGVVHYHNDGAATIPIFDEKDGCVYDIYFPTSRSEISEDNYYFDFGRYSASTGIPDPHLPITVNCCKFLEEYINEIKDEKENSKLKSETIDLDDLEIDDIENFDY